MNEASFARSSGARDSGGGSVALHIQQVYSCFGFAIFLNFVEDLFVSFAGLAAPVFESRVYSSSSCWFQQYTPLLHIIHV